MSGSEPHDPAYDYEYDDGSDDCDCSDYDVDFDGRAACPTCGRRWWLTPEQLAAYDEAEARWMEEYDRAQRWERWRRLCDVLTWHLWRKWIPRRNPRVVIDDDIPF